MDGVRGWRFSRPGEIHHTREVRSETLPAHVEQRLAALEMRQEQVIAHLAQLETDYQALIAALKSHSHEPIGFAELEHRVAAMERAARRVA